MHSATLSILGRRRNKRSHPFYFRALPIDSVNCSSMKSLLFPLILSMMLGCTTVTSTTDNTTNSPKIEDDPPPAGWFASFTPEQAKSVSPDYAKAILIARAAAEATETSPSTMDFSVSKEQEEWWVHVSFFGRFGAKKVHMAGGFCVVVIDKDWKVVRIIPGV